MPIRFPFRRAGPAETVDDNRRRASESSFEKTPVSGTKPKDIKEPVEYKLSGMSETHCSSQRPRNIAHARGAITT
jgi:hypothetical protein